MVVVQLKNYDTKSSDLEKKLTDHNYDKYIATPEFILVQGNVIR